MVEMTVQIPEELAARIRPFGPWLPTVLELGLAGFTTVASATASELIRFLAGAPSPREVLEYHVPDQTQTRLRRLLALNEAGLVGEDEARELDELQRIEHSVVMLKTGIALNLSEHAHAH